MELAKTWRSKYREDILVRIISSDPHPPGIYRVNSTLMNMSAFQKAYQTKPGDGMYRAPKDRVELWPDL
uniref:Peptidase M13 C-terminal domain-containing protein n=1 Tax=Vibrio algicola TaxID=2662262 RepID=A0A5Q0TB92_9VIBR